MSFCNIIFRKMILYRPIRKFIGVPSNVNTLWTICIVTNNACLKAAYLRLYSNTFLFYLKKSFKTFSSLNDNEKKY